MAKYVGRREGGAPAAPRGGSYYELKWRSYYHSDESSSLQEVYWGFLFRAWMERRVPWSDKHVD